MFCNFLAPKGKFKGPHTTCADELSVSFDAKILCPLPVIVYYCALAEGASLLQLYLIRGLGLLRIIYFFFQVTPANSICVYAHVYVYMYMTLDDDIRNIIEAVIENDMAAPKVPKKRVPKLKRIWKCHQVPDFLYGHRIGYYKGLAEGMILERYRRRLSEQEDNEVFEIVQPYIKVLRKYFAYYKDTRTKK